MTSGYFRTPKNLIDDQIKLSKLLDAPTPTQFYIVRGTTSEVVLQREEMLKERLDPLIEKRVISGYQALSNWVPSSRAQAARRSLIDQTLLYANGPLAASGCADRRGRQVGCGNARARTRIILVADPRRILEDSGQ